VPYRQRELFEADPHLAATKPEDQWFDRKSIRIEPIALANVLVGFANADGGTVVIGVEDSGEITGTDRYTDHLNRLRQAAIDYTNPLVRHTFDSIPCMTSAGQSDHHLVLEIHPSDHVHRNHRGETYKRIGDSTRRLNDEDARELVFDKGERPFDGVPVPNAAMRDLDPDALHAFAATIGPKDDVERALRVRGLTSDGHDGQSINVGAVLRFGVEPQSFLPAATIRILRYEGVFPRPGTRSNLVFDRRIDGRLVDQVETARQVMSNQLRQVTRLDEQTGQFVTIGELPRFAWLEAIVNAVTHRSYSLQGDHIRVSLFDDRMEVASPGRLPGPVRVDNIRQTRFSRNPKISRVLSDLRLVLELNEGRNRMFIEMEQAGLSEPILEQTDAGFKVILYNSSESERVQVRSIIDLVPPGFAPALDRLFGEGRVTTGQAAELTGFSLPSVRRHLRALETAGLLERVARSSTDPHAFWRSPQPLRGRWRARTLIETEHERTRKPN